MLNDRMLVLLIELVLMGMLIVLWRAPHVLASRSSINLRRVSPLLMALRYVIVVAAWAILALHCGAQLRFYFGFFGIMACWGALVLVWRLLYVLASHFRINLRPLLPWLMALRWAVTVTALAFLLLHLPTLAFLTCYLFVAIIASWSLIFPEKWIDKQLAV